VVDSGSKCRGAMVLQTLGAWEDGAGSVPASVVRGAGADRDLAARGCQPGRDGASAGRSSSTVSRELARNRLPLGGYQPSFAEGSYLTRRERLALLERDERLERFVVDRLTEAWGTRAARRVAEGRQRAGAARARHGNHLFLHLSGAAEGRESVEAVATRQGPPRPAQTPRDQEHHHRSSIDS
jgi:IS30 family transposase